MPGKMAEQRASTCAQTISAFERRGNEALRFADSAVEIGATRKPCGDRRREGTSSAVGAATRDTRRSQFNKMAAIIEEIGGQMIFTLEVGGTGAHMRPVPPSLKSFGEGDVGATMRALPY